MHGMDREKFFSYTVPKQGGHPQKQIVMRVQLEKEILFYPTHNQSVVFLAIGNCDASCPRCLQRRELYIFKVERSTQITSHDDGIQPLGFKRSTSLNTRCKIVATEYWFLVDLCAPKAIWWVTARDSKLN